MTETNAPFFPATRVMIGAASTVRMLVLPLITIVGALLRLRVALNFAPHVDEGNSLLAAHMVADHGIPLLPSGVLYPHGATLSYLAAPLVLLGATHDGNLLPGRLISVLAGVAAILLTAKLAAELRLPQPAMLLSALLVAIQPIEVVWGGRMRMYGLLEVVVLALAIIFLRALGTNAKPPATAASSWRSAAMIVATFWLATLTQMSASLLLPAMVVAALVVLRRDLLRRPDLLAAFALSALAPIVIAWLGATVGPGNSSTRAIQGAGVPGGSFVGDDIVSFTNLLHPDLSGWFSFFTVGWLPLLSAAATVVLFVVAVGWSVAHRQSPETAPARIGIVALSILYWVPVLEFALLSDEQRNRYLIFILPLGAVVIAAAAAILVELLTAPRDSAAMWPGKRLRQLSPALLVGVLLVNGVSGATVLEEKLQENDPDPMPALRYVKALRSPDETVVVEPPPEAYLIFGEDERIRVIGGALAITTPAGEQVDYWIGWPKLDSAGICRTLMEPAPAWFVMDATRLEPSNDKASDRKASDRKTSDRKASDRKAADRKTPNFKSEGIIIDGTTEVWRSADGIAVLRARPREEWGHSTTAGCRYVRPA